MKKLLLLSALLIFACSSDDSSDNSNQTFLERFDGVAWEGEFTSFMLLENPPPVYIAFRNNPKSKVRFVYFETQSSCHSHLLNGLTTPYGHINYPDIEVEFTIIENSSNVLTYSWVDDTINDELIGTSGLITYTANNQGDVLFVEEISSPANSQEENTYSYQCVRANIPFNCP
jgi:hypothetical protein